MADQSLTAFLISAFMVLSVQDACYEGGGEHRTVCNTISTVRY